MHAEWKKEREREVFYFNYEGLQNKREKNKQRMKTKREEET